MVKKIKKEEAPLSREERQIILRAKMTLINKKAGREVIQLASQAKSRNRIPFTSEEINTATGGGIPMGAFSVIWGSKAGGKTSSCYDLIANAQKLGLICQLYDFERSFAPEWAANFGVDPEFLTLGKFKNAEEGLDNVIKTCEDRLINLIIIDSIQGLCPIGEVQTKKGIHKSLADDTMGLLPKKLSEFFRKASYAVDNSNCAVVLIGQTRVDLGGFIKLEKLSGGNALLHWSSLTLNMRRGQKDSAPYIWRPPKKEGSKREKQLTGYEMVVKVDKSKVGPDEGKEARIPFYFGSGFTKTMEEEDGRIN